MFPIATQTEVVYALFGCRTKGNFPSAIQIVDLEHETMIGCS